jgi:hypothetical protein
MADDFLFAVFANDHPSDFHSQWLGIPIDEKGRGAREIDQIRVSLRVRINGMDLSLNARCSKHLSSAIISKHGDGGQILAGWSRAQRQSPQKIALDAV